MTLFEERNNPVGYAIRAKGTGRLEGACQEAYESSIHEEDFTSIHEEDFTYTASHPFYGEIRYQMTGSEKSRRVCFKLFFTEEEKAGSNGQIQLLLFPHIYAVITSLEDLSPEQVIAFYCQRGNSENFTKELKDDFMANTLSHRSFEAQRGNSENFTKELKDDFMANTLSHRSFEANAFEFFLKCLAYNLFHFFLFRIMEGSDQNMTAGSFRKKYQKTASRLSIHARRLYLKIASSFRYAQNSSFRYAQKFMHYLHKSRTVPWIPILSF